jgi:hypothetical protein
MQRKYPIIKLVRARKKLVKKVQAQRKFMQIHFDRLWYKFQDYEKFRRFITVIANFQRDFKIKMLRRRLRSRIQKEELAFDTFDMIKRRLYFKETIKMVTFVQKTWKWIRFIRLIRFAKYIKELIYEHYENVVWPEIRGLIQVRSCIKIQKTMRGHIIRCKYGEERTHMRIFRINLYQNLSAKKIQRFYKGWLVRSRIHEMKEACTVIQAIYRSIRMRKFFLIVRKATVVIQVVRHDCRTSGGCIGFRSMPMLMEHLKKQ